MNIVDAIDRGRQLGAQLRERGRQRKDQERISQILSQARDGASIGDIDNTIESILSQVSPDAQQVPLNLLSERRKQLQEKEIGAQISNILGSSDGVLSELDNRASTGIDSKISGIDSKIGTLLQLPQSKSRDDAIRRLQNDKNTLEKRQDRRAQIEAQEGREVLKSNLKTLEDVQAKGESADARIISLKENQRAINSGNTSGFKSFTINFLSTLGEGGRAVSDALRNEDQQALKSGQLPLIADLKKFFGANVSQREFQEFVSLLPSIGQSKEAALKANQILMKFALLDAKRAEFAEDLVDENGRPDPNIRRKLNQRIKDYKENELDKELQSLLGVPQENQSRRDRALEELRRRGAL